MDVVVFTGGAVLVDPVSADGRPVYSHALAFGDGLVLALGDEAIALAATATATVDLDGGILAPALGDGHVHPILGGLERLGPQVREASNLQGIIDAVAQWRAVNPDATWIIGASYDATFAENGYFDAQWLDAVTGDTPTVLRSWDYHSVWVNTAALAAGGLSAETPDPELGRIVRRADGSPLGTLFEDAANDFLERVAPRYTSEDRVAAIEYATAQFAAQGTTWIQDAWVTPEDLDTYCAAVRQGKLHVRVNLALKTTAREWRDHLASFVAAREKVRNLETDRLTANTVKIFVDGIIETHTASLLDPYADRPEETGTPRWSAGDLAAAVTAFDAHGFQVHFHAIGDAANRDALNAVEAALRANGVPRRPHVIAHVALLDPADVNRFEQLGVIANFQPYWAKCDAVMRDLTIPHLGHPRADWQYLIGSVHKSGAVLAFGSDWPVTTLDWRPALATAVTRTTEEAPDDCPWLPGQRIDSATAFSAYTKALAVQAGSGSVRGTLRAGQIADAVWLSADPLQVEPSALPQVVVEGTWLNGVRIYTR